MRTTIASLLALTIVVAAGCSDDSSGGTPDGGSPGDGSSGAPDAFSCETAKSACPNDEPFPVDACKLALNHPMCGQSYLRFIMCIGDHQVCKSDGTTDVDAWKVHCASQQAAVNQCFGPLDGG